MTVTAIIPVRAGSRRLPNKNILPFGETNLLLHKIEQLKKCKMISKIVVSSDSDKMLEMASNAGVDIHKRTTEYADDKSLPFGEVVKKICSEVDGDIILWSPCVCPMMQSETYDSAIETYIEKCNDQTINDSLVSVEILKWFLWDENGPINYEFGLKHVLSQDLPNIYHPTNAIFIASRENMIKWKYFHGVKPYKFIVDKVQAVDIDDKFDYMFARSLYESSNLSSI